MYGAKATINVWDPSIEMVNEFSLSQIWILSGSFDGSDLNSIEAGWQVFFSISYTLPHTIPYLSFLFCDFVYLMQIPRFDCLLNPKLFICFPLPLGFNFLDVFFFVSFQILYSSLPLHSSFNFFFRFQIIILLCFYVLGLNLQILKYYIFIPIFRV